MEQDIINVLKNSDFFNGLPDEVINELASQFEQSKLAKDDVLFNKGDVGDALYMIETGSVKMISNDKDGGEVVLNTVGSGAVIGEMALIDDEPRSAGVVALSDVTYLKLSEDDFLKVLIEQPQLGIQISRNAIQRLRFATTYIENAIEWSKRIAAGDYSFLNEKKKMSNSAITKSEADQLRAERFLGTFFKMVEDIKAREDDLKKQVSMLKVEINQSRRKEEVAELADSEFFKELRRKKKE
ncbi:MAG: cyclic nucleotide-binding domain-containing protein [Chloroflexota bacterium]